MNNAEWNRWYSLTPQQQQAWNAYYQQMYRPAPPQIMYQRAKVTTVQDEMMMAFVWIILGLVCMAIAMTFPPILIPIALILVSVFVGDKRKKNKRR